MSLTVSLRKTRTPLKRLGEPGRWGRCPSISKSWRPHLSRKWSSLLSRSRSSLTFLSRGQTRASRTTTPDLGFQLALRFWVFARNSTVEGWDLRACTIFFSPPRPTLASRWTHLRKVSTISDYIFFYLQLIKWYISRKIHKFYWCLNTRDSPSEGKSFTGTLSYTRTTGKCTQSTVFPCLCSPPETDSFDPQGSLHIRKALSDLETGHGHLLKLLYLLPQIFIGAYNSNSMGWERKISLDLRQRALI